ncbi:MAG: hypothetical protein HY832_01855 [Candidatus Aenigmarchaeota archaeon]|nr:hypothetical protein [Candidatus Aenigmarchaeota archaeon]
MPLDLLNEGHLHRFIEYRTNTFLKLYLCKQCIRSFETESKQTICKFCFGSDITELGEDRQCCSQCKTFFHGKNTTCSECSKSVVPIFQVAQLRKRERVLSLFDRTKHRIREKLPDVTIMVPYAEKLSKPTKRKKFIPIKKLGS